MAPKEDCFEIRPWRDIRARLFISGYTSPRMEAVLMAYSSNQIVLTE
jgi:hypothetical protein